MGGNPKPNQRAPLDPAGKDPGERYTFEGDPYDTRTADEKKADSSLLQRNVAAGIDRAGRSLWGDNYDPTDRKKNQLGGGYDAWVAGGGLTGGRINGSGGAGPSEYVNAATPDSSGPFGKSTSTVDPVTGKVTYNTGLSGPLGGASDNIQQQWADMLKKPMADGSAARDQAIDSAYKQSTSRLDPQWDKRQQMLQAQLLNQGLDPTSEAGKNAMQDFGLQRNDAYSSAMNNAIAQGTSAGDSVFRNNMSAYNNPLQQMAMLKALAQESGHPELLNALIAQKNNELGLSGQAMQANADLAAGGMQLAGSLASGIASAASDERLKQNIHRMKAEALPGVPWATWEYKDAPGRRCFGVIAQDLEKVAPEYVSRGADGMRMVDLRFLENAAAKESP